MHEFGSRLIKAIKYEMEEYYLSQATYVSDN